MFAPGFWRTRLRSLLGLVAIDFVERSCLRKDLLIVLVCNCSFQVRHNLLLHFDDIHPMKPLTDLTFAFASHRSLDVPLDLAEDRQIQTHLLVKLIRKVQFEELKEEVGVRVHFNSQFLRFTFVQVNSNSKPCRKSCFPSFCFDFSNIALHTPIALFLRCSLLSL